MIIAVWLSGGAASAVAAKLTVEKYGKENEVLLLNNPIAEEDADNQRFINDVSMWVNRKVKSVTNPKWPTCSAYDVWEKRRFMSGTKGAACTGELKIRARQEWENKNHCDYHVLGFTIEEKERFERFKLTERKNTIAPLVDEHITKQRCFDILASAGIALPRVYLIGYPNANCIGCVKSSSVEYWNHVRKNHPSVFESRAAQSRKINAKLVRLSNDKRIFLDELSPNEIGRPMKQYNFECGIFCEEK